nr:D626 [uncultured bacterium]
MIRDGPTGNIFDNLKRYAFAGVPKQDGFQRRAVFLCVGDEHVA